MFESMILTGESPLKNHCLFRAFIATKFELFNVDHGVSPALIVNPMFLIFIWTFTLICGTRNKKFDCRHKLSVYQSFWKNKSLTILDFIKLETKPDLFKLKKIMMSDLMRRKTLIKFLKIICRI